MRLHAAHRARLAAPERRGAVLLLSFLVLLVLILILQQIDFSTKTADRVERNEKTLESMDLAIESTLLSVCESLGQDGEADAAAGQGGGDAGGGIAGIAGAAGGAGGGAGGDQAAGGGGATDSHMDEWWGVNRQDFSSMEDVRVRVLVQDEDSKFNVFSVLQEDEDARDAALDRLARVIEFSRKATDAEIDGTTARRMAERIREILERRKDQDLPKPVLSSDSEDQEDRSLLSNLRELVGFDPDLFPEDLFRDYVDAHGTVVHSLGSFLTVWTSLSTAPELAQQAGATGGGAGGGAGAGAGGAGGAGTGGGNAAAAGGGGQGGGQPGSSTTVSGSGGAPQGGGGFGGAAGGGAGGGLDTTPTGLINVNTAPLAVLKALLDERDTPYDLWESVLRYRNERDEDVDQNEDPPLDEFGQEIVTLKFFDSLQELGQTDTWNELDPLDQAELESMLTVRSDVFSIFLTAYRPTGEDRRGNVLPTREETENEEATAQGLVRTVRSVVWRRIDSDGKAQIVPLVRWEELDYVPYEVLDFPPDESPSRR